MLFCDQCGHALRIGGDVCPECGFSGVVNDQYNESKKGQDASDRDILCPSCGESISKHSTICPSCRYEFLGSTANHSIESFVKQIELADLKIANSDHLLRKLSRTTKKLLWIILNIYLFGIPLLIYRPSKAVSMGKKLSPEERQKANLIVSHIFSNDRQSILAALSYMKTKVAIHATNGPKPIDKYWIRLWISKADEVYNKGLNAFRADPEIESIIVGIHSYKSHLKRSFSLLN